MVHNLPPPAQVKRLLKIKPSSGSNGGGCFIFSSEVKKVTMDTFGRLNQLFGTRGSIPETWKSKVTSGLHTLSPTISLIQSTQLFSSLFPCSCSSLINNGSFLFPPPPLCRNYTQGLSSYNYFPFTNQYTWHGHLCKSKKPPSSHRDSSVPFLVAFADINVQNNMIQKVKKWKYGGHRYGQSWSSFNNKELCKL